MQFPGFIGPSYTLDSVNVSAQRCVNLFPQTNEIPGKNGEMMTLRRTPGLEKACEAGTGPNLGLYTASNGRSFAVSGDGFYEITEYYPILRGALKTSGAQCSMDDNGTQLLIVDGNFGYVFTFATNSYQTITDPDFPKASHCCFIDQYIIVNDVNTRLFYVSALADATDWDGLDFAAKEGAPDNLRAVVANQKELYLIGDSSSEIWFDSGDALFPFARVQGAFMEMGTGAPDTVKKLDGSIYMLHQDKNGDGIVVKVTGYSPTRVSNHAVEKAITDAKEAGNDVSYCSAWVYQQDGHSFYCLNITNAKSTWVYDVYTGLWHERDSWTAQGFTRNRAQNHCMISGQHVVGDWQSGNIYRMKKNVYSENGDPLRWMRRFPHLSKEMRRVFVSEFRLDLEMGVGTSSVPDPQVVLRTSRDGGHRWSPELRRSMGKQGQYRNRVMWNKLGSGRDLVFEVSGSDAVPANLISAFLDVSAGAH